jgi:hypothetical protein
METITKKFDSYHLELKKRTDNCYATIKKCNEELQQIREKECKHPQTEKVNYEWAPGHIHGNTEVCSVCGKVIKLGYDNPKIEMNHK